MPDNDTPTPDNTAALIRAAAAERLTIAARIVREGGDDSLALDLMDEAKSRLFDAIVPDLGRGVL
jgi:hypothetical protein